MTDNQTLAIIGLAKARDLVVDHLKEIYPDRKIQLLPAGTTCVQGLCYSYYGIEMSWTLEQLLRTVEKAATPEERGTSSMGMNYVGGRLVEIKKRQDLVCVGLHLQSNGVPLLVIAK